MLMNLIARVGGQHLVGDDVRSVQLPQTSNALALLPCAVTVRQATRSRSSRAARSSAVLRLRRRTRCATLCITHTPLHAPDPAARAIKLHDGRIVDEGTYASVWARHASDRAEAGQGGDRITKRSRPSLTISVPDSPSPRKN